MIQAQASVYNEYLRISLIHIYKTQIDVFSKEKVLLTRVQVIFNMLLKIVFISNSIRGWRKREMNQPLATVLVSFRSLSLPIIHHHFLVFSHQGTFPHLYPRSAPDNFVRNNIISDTMQTTDASQTFSPRNAPQGRRTRSAPKFSFFFKFVFA